MALDLKSEVQNRVLAVRDLPSLPRVFEEISRRLNDPRSSMEEIAQLVALDQALTAKVLRMVNSPLYGFPRRIGSIDHAIVLLGLNVIRGLIVCASVLEVAAGSMVGLWEHSVGCALACREIARWAGFKDADEYAVAGLLHDLGKVVVFVQMPDIHERIQQTQAETGVCPLEAERAVLGFGHDRINAWLADHWNLPRTIKEGMAGHHLPSSSRYHSKYAAVVHVGDFLAKVLEIGDAGNDGAPALDPLAFSSIGLALEELEPILDRVIEKRFEVASFTLC